MKDKAPSPIATGDISPQGEANIGKFFGDPFAEKVAAEDPVFRFISKNWRNIVTSVVAAVAIFYAYNVFQETQRSAMESAGDGFIQVQREFDSYVGLVASLSDAKKKDLEKDAKAKEEVEKLQKQVDDAKKRMQNSIEALSNTREPYVRLAVLYRGLLARESGDAQALKGIFSATAWAEIKNLNSNERLLAELEGLAYARALLDSDSTVGEARSLLKRLSIEGNFVHVAAGLSLAAIASSQAERKEALSVLGQINDAHPEQNSLLRDELNRLK